MVDISNLPVSQKLKIGGRDFVWGMKTYVMGVVNVTPDSFSGDGIFSDPAKASDQAMRFEDEGADFIDVGGESTRPASVYKNAKPVSASEELNRVVPAIEAIVKAVSLPVCIDTRKATVALRAVEAGAGLINDVTMLRGDPKMVQIVSNCKVPVVVSHNRNQPKYKDLIGEIIVDLMESVLAAEKSSITRDNILIDPGIGFGKTTEQNLTVLRELRQLTQLGFPVMIGTSRKSSIGAVLELPVNDRTEGTAATIALAIGCGVDIVRVHEVREMVRVARMADAVVRGWTPLGH